jgi:hypothetical protein
MRDRPSLAGLAARYSGRARLALANPPAWDIYRARDCVCIRVSVTWSFFTFHAFDNAIKSFAPAIKSAQTNFGIRVMSYKMSASLKTYRI